jgi:dipeptidyl-peptidase 4
LRSFVCWLAIAWTATLSSAFGAQGQEAANELTVQKIFGYGPLTGTPPSGLAWSPDAQHLTYIDNRELVEIEPAAGKPHILVGHTKLATLRAKSELNEEDKDYRQRYGMSSYLWAPDSKHLLFDSNGSLWYYELANGTGIDIGFTGSAAGDDPKFSPNGEYVSFVRNHGLAIVPLLSADTPTITLAGSPNANILNGEVDWVYLEELGTRSNYFWSPDSKSIAYLQMLEENVPEYPITDWIPTHATVEKQRYPQPGDPNPDVRVGVVSVKGGKTSWVHIPIEQGQDYIPRFGWVDGKTLWVETLSRDQKHRRIYFADPRMGTAHLVLEINDEKFVNEYMDAFVAHGCIVLTNWADGHNHIYLYRFDEGKADSARATLERQLTKGEFDVAELYRVDPSRKEVLYSSNEGDPQDRQAWKVSFDGERTQLTEGAGFHDVQFASIGGNYANKFSTRKNPPVVKMCGVGTNCVPFWSSSPVEELALRAPTPIEVKGKDGTVLYGTLLMPADVAGIGSVPLIVNPYGGPYVQTVVNRWSDSVMFDELLAQHGFAVLHADNRGMGMRGREFAQAAYRNFGPVQLEDQLTVIDAVLAKHPELDGQRLGWWGGSWGGTLTLYGMTHSDRFKAGIALAPVTDWRDYDSVYTERYLSKPQEDPEGYKDSSVVNSAAKLKGRLLLVHGTGDDNVHLENTVQFLQKLIEAKIPYDLQIYPRKTHSFAGSDVRVHLYGRILAHFEQYLAEPLQ